MKFLGGCVFLPRTSMPCLSLSFAPHGCCCITRPVVIVWTVCYRFHTFTTNLWFRNLDLIVKIYYDRSFPTLQRFIGNLGASKAQHPQLDPKGDGHGCRSTSSRFIAEESNGTGYASNPKPPKSRNASSKESLRTTSASTMNLGPPSTRAGCATSA